MPNHANQPQKQRHSESISTSSGVPQIILPQWANLYGFAALAETIGVGVWACRQTNPGWTVDSLTQITLKLVDGSEASISMRETARQLGATVRSRGKGRDIAAHVVAIWHILESD